MQKFISEYTIPINDHFAHITLHIIPNRSVVYYNRHDEHKSQFYANDCNAVLNNPDMIIVSDSNILNNKWTLVYNRASGTKAVYVSKNGTLHKSMAIHANGTYQSLKDKDCIFDTAEEAFAVLNQIHSFDK